MIEAFLLSIATFGIWFWAVFILWLIIACVGIKNESPSIVTIMLAAGLAFLEFFTEYQVLTFAVTHPILTLGGIVLYLVIGALYGMLRWQFYIKDKLTLFKMYINENASRYASLGRTDQLKHDAFVSVFGGYRNHTSDYAPLIKDHKAKFYGWISLWWLNAVFLLIDEPITKFCRWVYVTFSGRLQEYANRQFRSVE